MSKMEATGAESKLMVMMMMILDGDLNSDV